MHAQIRKVLKLRKVLTPSDLATEFLKLANSVPPTEMVDDIPPDAFAYVREWGLSPPHEKLVTFHMITNGPDWDPVRARMQEEENHRVLNEGLQRLREYFRELTK